MRLTPGLYLDHNGVLQTGPLPAVPAYSLPGGVLATASEVSKLANTFSDIGDALPDASDTEKFDKFTRKLAALGAPEGLNTLLGTVGQIAGVIGSAFVVLGVAVAAAKLLGLFGDGPSPLESLVKARFDALDREVRALQALGVQRSLESQRNALSSARATVESFVSQRDSGTMTAAQIESRLQPLVTNLSLLSANQILGLLDATTYTVFFDPDEHTKVWPWTRHASVPDPSRSGPQQATFPMANAPVFDSRLAVPLAAQAAQTFLGLIHSLAPEFRTTGDFRPTVREFADKLSTLAATLRNTTLGPDDLHRSRFRQPRR